MGLSSYADQITIEENYLADDVLHVWIKILPSPPQICKKCSCSNFKLKDYQSCTVRHNCSKNKKILLHVKRPRFVCKECHHTIIMNIPFVFDDFKDMSAQMILDILNELKYTNHSITEIAHDHGISEHCVLNIFDSRVSFSHGIPTSYMCIDEKCFGHGNTKFMLVIMDFQTNSLIDICSDRKKATLLEWLRFARDNYIIPPEDSSKDTSGAYNKGEQRTIALKGFCIDMNQYFYDAIHLIFPSVPIAIDSFHVIKNINHELNKIRINVMNRYFISKYQYDPENGELLDEETIDEKQPMEYRALKKYWKLFLITKPPYKLKPEDKKYNKILQRYADPSDILDYMLTIDKTLTKAWELKEKYIHFNQSATFDEADKWLDMIIKNYLNSGISSFEKLAKMLIHWKSGIINSFIRIDKRRLSNGGMEGMNSKIQTIITNARGIHKFERLRNRLLLRFGKEKNYRLNKIK